MSNIRFWYAAGACSLAPHILLHEVGADFDAVQMEITPEGANFPDGFEAINPKMRVPVLMVDHEIITEVPAIATAISSMAPTRQLMGRDTLQTVRVYEWMTWLSGSLHGQGFGCFWRPHRYSDDPAVHDGIKRKGMTTIADCFATIDKNIVGPYALGDAFTAVDPYLYVFYRWGNLIGLDLNGDYPKFADLGRTLAVRSSVAVTIAEEKVDPYGHFAVEPVLPTPPTEAPTIAD